MTNDRLHELIAEYAATGPRDELRNLLYPAASVEEIRELIDGYRKAPCVCVWTSSAERPLAYTTSCGESRSYVDKLPPYCSQCGGEVVDPDAETRNNTADVAAATCRWTRNYAADVFHTQCGHGVTAAFAEVWYRDGAHQRDRCMFCGAKSNVE